MGPLLLGDSGPIPCTDVILFHPTRSPVTPALPCFVWISRRRKAEQTQTPKAALPGGICMPEEALRYFTGSVLSPVPSAHLHCQIFQVLQEALPGAPWGSSSRNTIPDAPTDALPTRDFSGITGFSQKPHTCSAWQLLQQVFHLNIPPFVQHIHESSTATARAGMYKQTECLKNPSAYEHKHWLCTILLPFPFRNYTANPVPLTCWYFLLGNTKTFCYSNTLRRNQPPKPSANVL